MGQALKAKGKAIQEIKQGLRKVAAEAVQQAASSDFDYDDEMASENELGSDHSSTRTAGTGTRAGPSEVLDSRDDRDILHMSSSTEPESDDMNTLNNEVLVGTVELGGSGPAGEEEEEGGEMYSPASSPLDPQHAYMEGKMWKYGTWVRINYNEFEAGQIDR